MTTDHKQQILILIARLSHCARLAEALSLDDTGRLLAMALLDLQTTLHSISPHELRSFTRTVANVVEFRARVPANDTKRPETDENSHNGHLPVVG